MTPAVPSFREKLKKNNSKHKKGIRRTEQRTKESKNLVSVEKGLNCTHCSCDLLN
jgi:hypothetical protein